MLLRAFPYELRDITQPSDIVCNIRIAILFSSCGISLDSFGAKAHRACYKYKFVTVGKKLEVSFNYFYRMIRGVGHKHTLHSCANYWLIIFQMVLAL